jgi:MFS family permease
MWTIAGGAGPVLGGVLTQYASWRWVFWINLPISSLAFLLLVIFLDVHNPKTRFWDGVKAIDWCGSFSILALMVMLLLGLNFGGVIFPWNSTTVICLIVFGSFMSFFFVVSESKLARYPIMPMDLFRHKSNVACLVVGFMHDFVSDLPSCNEHQL